MHEVRTMIELCVGTCLYIVTIACVITVLLVVVKIIDIVRRKK